MPLNASFNIVMFLRQLATLLSAGVPIIQSCNMLAASQKKDSIRKLIGAIKRELDAGRSLFYSLKNQSDYFDLLTCHLVAMGEQTGKLEAMLLLAAHYHETKQMERQRIRQALFYPTLVMVVALIITIGMFLFVIPQFEKLFQTTSIQLPWLTRGIFYFSSLLRQSIIWIGVIASIGWLLFLVLRREPHHHPTQRAIFLRIPGIKQFIDKITLAQFVRHVAITLSAGIPINQALALTGNTTHHAEFNRTISKVIRSIQSGSTLYQAMSQQSLFPTLLLQMTKIGEECGKLEEMILAFANLIDAEIARLMQHLHILLEPLIMVVLGVLIGGLVIGMYLPLFQLGSTL